MLAFVLGARVGAAEDGPVIFLVRHGEKATSGGDDPHLSAVGQRRAEALARLLQHMNLAAVFTTEFKRTRETAAPTARAAHLTPTIIPGRDLPALIQKLRALRGSALVVGHSNTVPKLIKALGVTTPITIADDDYSELFTVVLSGKPQLIRVQYSP